MSGPYVAEMSAKPVGFILLSADERAEFDALSEPQKGYFLHWVRSNPGYTVEWWNRALRKARAQRPNPTHYHKGQME